MYSVTFSGGGAFGSWEVGCLKFLVEHYEGEYPNVVTGASAGAINAASVCAGLSVDELSSLWFNISPKNVYRFPFFQFIFWIFSSLPLGLLKGYLSCSTLRGFIGALDKFPSIFTIAPLQKTLQKHLLPKEQVFFSNEMKLAINITDLSRGSGIVAHKNPPPRKPDRYGEWVPINNGNDLINRLLSSTAIPVLFPGQKGQFDGGILRNHPVGPARHYLRDFLGKENFHDRLPPIYILIPSVKSKFAIGGIISTFTALIDAWINQSLITQLKAISMSDLSQNIETPICIIRPEKDLGEIDNINLLSFGQSVKLLIKNGYEAAKQRINNFDLGDKETWDNARE